MPEISLLAQEFDQKKQEKLLQPKLLDQLRKVLPFENHVIWGHGTLSESAATSILNQGISGNPNYDLFSIATPLTSNEKSDDENAQYIVDQSSNWPQKNAKYVVLLGVPYGVKPNNVVERTNDEKKGERSSVPRRFVIGYIDVDKQAFVKSKFFTVNAEPIVGLIKQKSLLPQGQRHNIQLPIPHPIPSVADLDDKIW